MHAEVVSVGEHGAYAVDLIIAGERFRVKYFSQHRVDPLKDARKYSARLGEAVKREGVDANTRK